MIDQLLPVMHDFFSSLERSLELSLNAPMQFYKRIPNEEYAAWWNKRLEDHAFTNYMGEIEGDLGPVLKAGMIDCTKLKQAYAQHLMDRGLLTDATFEFEHLEFLDHGIRYNNRFFDAIIFCEGAHAINNPYFNWLPFNICKGEWLIIRAERDLGDRVINNVINLIPLGEQHYKLSSTYAWDDLSWNASEKARTELLQVFESQFDCAYEVIEQRAGLRPTVADRRPYLGAHPQHKQAFIFNGLGSKGVMLAPYFSKHLMDHIVHGSPLMPEVDIKRHQKRFAAHPAT